MPINTPFKEDFKTREEFITCKQTNYWLFIEFTCLLLIICEFLEWDLSVEYWELSLENLVRILHSCKMRSLRIILEILEVVVYALWEQNWLSNKSGVKSSVGGVLCPWRVGRGPNSTLHPGLNSLNPSLLFLVIYLLLSLFAIVQNYQNWSISVKYSIHSPSWVCLV